MSKSDDTDIRFWELDSDFWDKLLTPEESKERTRRILDFLLILPPEERDKIDNYDGLVAHLEKVLEAEESKSGSDSMK